MTSGSLHQFTIHMVFGSLTGVLGVGVKNEQGVSTRMGDDGVEGEMEYFGEYADWNKYG